MRMRSSICSMFRSALIGITLLNMLLQLPAVRGHRVTTAAKCPQTASDKLCLNVSATRLSHWKRVGCLEHVAAVCSPYNGAIRARSRRQLKQPDDAAALVAATSSSRGSRRRHGRESTTHRSTTMAAASSSESTTEYREDETTQSVLLSETISTAPADAKPVIPTTSSYETEGFIAEWVWTTSYLTGNVEKLVLYSLLGFSFGLVCVLLIIIVRMCCTRSCPSSSGKHKLHRNSYSPSTEQGTPPPPMAPRYHRRSGSPVWSWYDDTGARLAKSSPPLSPQATVARQPPPPGNGWSSGADDNGTDSSQIDIVDNQQPLLKEPPWSAGVMSQSLGRSYTNPYRHDSYRVDGMKTLQLR